MDIPIDIFSHTLNKWENGHSMSVIPTSYTWHDIHLLLSVSFSFISYILHLHIFSPHIYMSCHLHVIKGYLFIKVITTYIGSYIKQISYSGMHSLTINSIPHQKPPHSYFLIPLSADTHLMDPLLFPLSVFHHTSQMPASPLMCFLQSSSSSLFTLSLSLPFCDLVRKKTENPCRDRQSSASDREAHRLWSLTADEAHWSSWLTDLGKSWRQANLARLVCSTTAYRQTDRQRAQSHQLRAHRGKAQSQQPTPHPHAYISSALVLPSHPPLLTHSYHIPPNSRIPPSTLHY